ncbi:MAG: hypothetical protein WC645_07230 [Candidatus Margulisiibacteriota bacterium]
MKKLILAFLICALAAGVAFGNFTDRIKAAQNCHGLKCLEIPKFLEEKQGFQIVKQDWLEEKMGDAVKVTLKIAAQKEIQVDGVYLSYSWNPEWVWSVNPQDGAITPLNDRARDWMMGKL